MAQVIKKNKHLSHEDFVNFLKDVSIVVFENCSTKLRLGTLGRINLFVTVLFYGQNTTKNIQHSSELRGWVRAKGKLSEKFGEKTRGSRSRCA